MLPAIYSILFVFTADDTCGGNDTLLKFDYFESDKNDFARRFFKRHFSAPDFVDVWKEVTGDMAPNEQGDASKDKTPDNELHELSDHMSCTEHC